MNVYLTEQTQEHLANVNINLHFLLQNYHAIILITNSIVTHLKK